VNETLWLILLLCFLSGLSVFFLLNIIALRSFSRVKLQEVFRTANKEDHTGDIVENAEKLVLTCSLFRFIVNIALLVLLTLLLIAKDHIITFVIILFFMGLISLSIAHSWAKYIGENLLLRTYKFLNVLSAIATPCLIPIRLHDSVVRRLAGVSQITPEQAQEEKQEEILSIVEEGKMEGLVDEEEMEMIENVLELGDTTAEEIMTPRTDLIAVKFDDNLEAVLKTVSSAGHSRIPVYKDNMDSIIGLVYAKDLLAEIGKDPKDFKLTDKMRNPYFVPETKSLKALLHEFQTQKLHIAIVLDEYGGTAGIVTIEDILEELVGEIADEYEETPPEGIKRISDTVIDVEARTYIDDLNSEFELNLPEDEDYDTVGGFVFSHLGYIPKAGEKFEYQKIRFTIISAEARKIKRIKIQMPQHEQKTGQ